MIVIIEERRGEREREGECGNKPQFQGMLKRVVGNVENIEISSSFPLFILIIFSVYKICIRRCMK